MATALYTELQENAKKNRTVAIQKTTKALNIDRLPFKIEAEVAGHYIDL